MRITINGKDYTYTVLTRGINKETTSIKINIMEEEFTLIRNEHRQWYAMEMAIGDLAELLRVVTKNVVLRYRL